MTQQDRVLVLKTREEDKLSHQTSATTSISSSSSSQSPATDDDDNKNDIKPSLVMDRSAEIRTLEMKIAACDEELLAYRAATTTTTTRTTRWYSTTTTTRQKHVIAKKQKQRALDILRRKRQYELQKESLLAHSANLELIQIQLESAQATMMTVHALAAARNQLAKLQQHMTVDDVDDMALDLQEFNEELSHVDAVMGERTLLYGVPDLDEHDLEAEFLQLEDELWDNDVDDDPDGGALEIPIAPQSKPTMPKRTADHPLNVSAEEPIVNPTINQSITNGPATTSIATTHDTLVEDSLLTHYKSSGTDSSSAIATTPSFPNNSNSPPNSPDCNILQARGDGLVTPASSPHVGVTGGDSLLTTSVVPSQGEQLVPPRPWPTGSSLPPPNHDDSFCLALDGPRKDITDVSCTENNETTTITTAKFGTNGPVKQIMNDQSCGSAKKSIGSPRSVAESIDGIPAAATTKSVLSANKKSASSRSIASSQMPTAESIDGIPYYDDEATARSGASVMNQFIGPSSIASPFRPANYPPAYVPPASSSIMTPKMQLRGIPETPSLATYSRGDDDQNVECRWGESNSSLPRMVVTSCRRDQPLDEIDELESIWTDNDTVQHDSKAIAPESETATIAAMLATDTSFGRHSVGTTPVESIDGFQHGDEATTYSGSTSANKHCAGPRSVASPIQPASYSPTDQTSGSSFYDSKAARTSSKMQIHGTSGTQSLPSFSRGEEQDTKSRWTSPSLPGMVVTASRDPPLDDIDDVESTWTDNDSVLQEEIANTGHNRSSGSASQSHSSTRSIHFHYHFPAAPIEPPTTNIRQRTSSNGSSIVVETQVWTNHADLTSSASTKSWNNTTMDRRPDDLAGVIAKSVTSFDSHMTPKSTAYTGEQAMTGLTTVVTSSRQSVAVEKPSRSFLQHFLRPVITQNK